MVTKTKRDTGNRVVVTNSSGNQSTSPVTSTELSSIDGNTSDSNITMADADRFVVNDSGIMRQLKALNVFTYIKNKILSGTISIGRVIMSDGDGKLYSSRVTDAQLFNSIAYKKMFGGAYSSGSSVVCEGIEGYKVWFDITSTQISLKIKNTSTSNLTVNGVISSGGDGSSDGGGWYEDVGAGDYTITSLIKGQVSDGSRNASKAGLVLFSTKESSPKIIALQYAMHNTDSSKYTVYCKVEDRGVN